MPDLPDYDSPSALKLFLENRDMAMQKKFGQNFMVNRTHRERLVNALGIETGTTVWEVGPGLGAMTDLILTQGADLTVFEIDRGFCTVLRDIFSDRKNFTLIEGDVLKTWKKAVDKGIPSCLFGNLPYNIAAAIIGDLITAGIRFDTVVITVQKEVALRMAAKPGTEDYSSFSILCQWAYDVSPMMDLAAGSFWPRPNVTSRAIKMTKKAEWPVCASPEIFMSVLRGLFSSRRKTVKNNLSAWLSASGKLDASDETHIDDITRTILTSASIDPGIRAEELSVKDFIRLSDVISSYGKS